MRFEESTRSTSKAVSSVLVFAFAAFSGWAGQTWDIDGVGWQILSGSLTVIAILLGCTLVYRIVCPYTWMLEITDDQLRFGRIRPTDFTVVLHYRELTRAIIDADEGYVWVEDSQGKTHLISGELSLCQKDFTDIKTVFEQSLSRENVIFRPFIGTELSPVTSRMPE